MFQKTSLIIIKSIKSRNSQEFLYEVNFYQRDLLSFLTRKLTIKSIAYHKILQQVLITVETEHLLPCRIHNHNKKKVKEIVLR